MKHLGLQALFDQLGPLASADNRAIAFIISEPCMRAEAVKANIPASAGRARGNAYGRASLAHVRTRRGTQTEPCGPEQVARPRKSPGSP